MSHDTATENGVVAERVLNADGALHVDPSCGTGFVASAITRANRHFSHSMPALSDKRAVAHFSLSDRGTTEREVAVAYPRRKRDAGKLNLFIDTRHHLIARWSCSTLLLRHLQARTSTFHCFGSSRRGNFSARRLRYATVQRQFERPARSIRNENPAEEQLCHCNTRVRV
jgi:hypothetical protein